MNYVIRTVREQHARTIRSETKLIRGDSQNIKCGKRIFESRVITYQYPLVLKIMSEYNKGIVFGHTPVSLDKYFFEILPKTVILTD